MIIFFNKKTGEIIGTIDGRKHTKEHLNMWIGDKNEIDRLVIEWVETKSKTIIEEVPEFKQVGVDQSGQPIFKRVVKKIKRKIPILEPDHKQKDLINIFEKNTREVYNYRVDVKTKQFIRKK